MCKEIFTSIASYNVEINTTYLNPYLLSILSIDVIMTTGPCL